MGHISANYLNYLQNPIEGVGDIIFNASLKGCTECAYAKLKLKSFTKQRKRAKWVSKIVHTDVVDLIQPPTHFSQNRYTYCD